MISEFWRGFWIGVGVLNVMWGIIFMIASYYRKNEKEI